MKPPPPNHHHHNTTPSHPNANVSPWGLLQYRLGTGWLEGVGVDIRRFLIYILDSEFSNVSIYSLAHFQPDREMIRFVLSLLYGLVLYIV